MQPTVQQISILLRAMGAEDRLANLNKGIAEVPGEVASIPMMKRPSTKMPRRLSNTLDELASWSDVELEPGTPVERQGQAATVALLAKELQRALSPEAIDSIITPVAQRYVP